MCVLCVCVGIVTSIVLFLAQKSGSENVCPTPDSEPLHTCKPNTIFPTIPSIKTCGVHFNQTTHSGPRAVLTIVFVRGFSNPPRVTTWTFYHRDHRDVLSTTLTHQRGYRVSTFGWSAGVIPSWRVQFTQPPYSMISIMDPQKGPHSSTRITNRPMCNGHSLSAPRTLFTRLGFLPRFLSRLISANGFS
jgi:hypothetical protein